MVTFMAINQPVGRDSWNSDLRKTAHHEAGHAVIAIIVGPPDYRFQSVVIHRPGGDQPASHLSGAVIGPALFPARSMRAEYGTFANFARRILSGPQPRAEAVYRQDMEAQCLVAFAGPLAEAKLCNSSPELILDKEAEGDRIMIENCIRFFDPGEDAFSIARHRLEQRASRLVATHWRDIEAVAVALIRRGELQFDEVAQLIGAS